MLRWRKYWTNLVHVVRKHNLPACFAPVLLLDDDARHARHGAAPSLPSPTTKAIDGLCIGPKAGSCGHRHVPQRTCYTSLIFSRIRSGSRTEAWPSLWISRWLLVPHPYLTHSGNTPGSVAMYYRETARVRAPAETRALEMATHLGRHCIERKAGA